MDSYYCLRCHSQTEGLKHYAVVAVSVVSCSLVEAGLVVGYMLAAVVAEIQPENKTALEFLPETVLRL